MRGTILLFVETHARHRVHAWCLLTPYNRNQLKPNELYTCHVNQNSNDLYALPATCGISL